MDRSNSFTNESSRQYLGKLGLASKPNAKSRNAEKLSKELFQLPIDALNNELNNSSLQFHLKAENNRISYKVVDFGKQDKKDNSFLNSELSRLAHFSASLDQSDQKMNRTSTTSKSSLKRKQTPVLETQFPSLTENGTKNNAEKRSKHNEIERKRRDKINNWIIKLSKMVPDCQDDSGKQSLSKGVILSKACDYITDLKKGNSKLISIQEENGKLRKELSETRKDNFNLVRENVHLKGLLTENGIAIKEQKNKK